MLEPEISVKCPSPSTLAKYGLDEDTWRRMLIEQGGVCAVCGKVPKCGFLCVDHEHVRGFKKLPRAERRRFVRGLCCQHCNHRLCNKHITIPALRRVLRYLLSYSRRNRK